MRVVNVDVIVYAPTAFFHCQHCEVAFQQLGIGQRVHREEAREALPQDLLDQYQAVCDWLRDLARRHGALVRPRVTDAASIAGVWRSLRHGVRSYPAVIVDGRPLDVANLEQAGAVVDDLVSGARSAPGSRNGSRR